MGGACGFAGIAKWVSFFVAFVAFFFLKGLIFCSSSPGGGGVGGVGGACAIAQLTPKLKTPASNNFAVDFFKDLFFTDCITV